MPRVSVLLPVRNDEGLVADAIDSVLRQTLTDFELLVLDDASTDRTCDIVRERAARDRRVKLLRQERPLGLASTLNRGLGAGRAPLVARTSARTRCDPRRLERQAQWLAAHPFTVLVGTDAVLLDNDGLTTGMTGGPADYARIREALVQGNAVIPETMLWRRREIESVGLYAVDPGVSGAEDFELVVRVAARYRVDNLKEMLVALAPPTGQLTAWGAANASAHVVRLARELFSGAPETPLEAAPPVRARGKLFVAIAAYRDPELNPTLDDLFARAARPDDITVGVCLQYDPRVDAQLATVATRPDQVCVVHVHPSETLGLGWARQVTERLWQGEEHVLQIDSHMRFADAWDDRLLDQLDRCASRFPILTTYPPGYTPPRQLQTGPPPRLRALHFTPEGLLLLGATGDVQPSAPVPSAFFAGGYAFSAGAFLREVPADPLMYFNATEPTHMVRAWTSGWDPFAPAENLLYHLYSAEKRQTPLHWQDRSEWAPLAARGQQRARHLLGMERADDLDALQQIERYGLGTCRTLAAYQAFAGIDFQSRSVSSPAREGHVNPRDVRARD